MPGEVPVSLEKASRLIDVSLDSLVDGSEGVGIGNRQALRSRHSSSYALQRLKAKRAVEDPASEEGRPMQLRECRKWTLRRDRAHRVFILLEQPTPSRRSVPSRIWS